MVAACALLLGMIVSVIPASLATGACAGPNSEVCVEATPDQGVSVNAGGSALGLVCSDSTTICELNQNGQTTDVGVAQMSVADCSGTRYAIVAPDVDSPYAEAPTCSGNQCASFYTDGPDDPGKGTTVCTISNPEMTSNGVCYDGAGQYVGTGDYYTYQTYHACDTVGVISPAYPCVYQTVNYLHPDGGVDQGRSNYCAGVYAEPASCGGQPGEDLYLAEDIFEGGLVEHLACVAP